MNLLRIGAALVLVLIACERGSTPDLPSRPDAPATEAPTASDLSFPGGGRILFLAARGPIYDGRKIGLLEPDGTVRRYPLDHAFPYWDPAAPDRLLLLPGATPSHTISLAIDGDALRPMHRWRTSEIPVYPSLDGRTIAFTPVDRSGRPRSDVLRVIERPTGTVKTVSTGGLIPLGWTPDRRLIAAPTSGGGLVRWNPWTGGTSTFAARSSDVAWDHPGNRYADAIGGDAEGTKGLVVVRRSDGDVIGRVSVGRRWVETPTWSPDGDRIAFIVRGAGRRGHRTATLHVYDVRLGSDRVVADGVSHARWASWSPDGRWLLVDDWTRDRWLFVEVDGIRREPYPRLGHFPRWCCPSSPPISVPIPVS